MVEHEGDDSGYAERISAYADSQKDAWKQTLDDMQAIAEELEADGWETTTIASGHTAPEPPDAGTTDRFGLVHVIPGNLEQEFADAFENGTFPQYKVYRNQVEGREFTVTQLMDPETKTAILIAGTFELRHASGLVKAAEREGEMYTHVQKLDKTHLGSFRHEDIELFFPDPERYKQYVARNVDDE